MSVDVHVEKIGALRSFIVANIHTVTFLLAFSTGLTFMAFQNYVHEERLRNVQADSMIAVALYTLSEDVRNGDAALLSHVTNQLDVRFIEERLATVDALILEQQFEVRRWERINAGRDTATPDLGSGLAEQIARDVLETAQARKRRLEAELRILYATMPRVQRSLYDLTPPLSDSIVVDAPQPPAESAQND